MYRHRTGADPETERPVFGHGTSRHAKIGEDAFPRIRVFPGCAYAFGILYHGVKSERTVYAAPLKSMGSAEISWRLQLVRARVECGHLVRDVGRPER